MNPTRIVMSAAALLAGFACALAPVAAAPISYRDLLARPRPTATQRVHYGEAPSEFADLWLPSGSESHPVVVMLHGGC